VVHDPAGRLDAPGRAADLDRAARAIAEVPHVTGVTTPDARAGTLSDDGRTGYLTVTFDVPAREVTPALAGRVLDAAGPAGDDGAVVAPTGVLARDRAGSRRSEAAGLAVAAVVLVVALGGVVAAGLPLVTALTGLVCGVGLVGLAGHLTGVPGVATTLGTMIGLGVGIDYALFLVTRYRALTRDGLPPREAAVGAAGTAGAAVVFAGGTVVIALSGLAVAGVPLLTTLGWTAGVVVLVAVAAATTLVPALLALLGHRLDRRPRPARRTWPRRRAPRPARAEGGGWARLADAVTRRPWRVLAGTTLLLALLAAPAAGLRPGQTDAGDDPVGSPSRTGHDLVAAGFGPGANGPLLVVAEIDGAATRPDDARLTALRERVAAVPGVAAAGPPRVSRDGSAASLTVRPATGPGDPRTLDVAAGLRDVRVPGLAVHVTGQTAVRGELGDRIGARLPWVVGCVVALSTLLLLAAFRAPVLALKAAVMNLVSVGAAYGVLTAVFQDGHGARLIGLDGPVPVESYVPVLLFALLFGLAMDYEVFLLSAVREAWEATGDNRVAVRTGLAATGRVITSAALIMVAVFAGFVLEDDPVVKMFGLGMAVAVAVDATVIRGLLVPATMAVLGRRNWWRPARRRRPPGPARPPAPRRADVTQPIGEPSRTGRHR
jgi:RND superfamily putative drug exporter